MEDSGNGISLRTKSCWVAFRSAQADLNSNDTNETISLLSVTRR